MLEEDEFQALGQQLSAQREELGALLARGNAGAIFPALRSFLYLCGLDFVPEAAEAQRASFTFLRTVVETLDKQLTRQSGGVLDPRAAAPGAEHPLVGIAPERVSCPAAGKTWEEILGVWREYVEDRPKSTTIAYQTPWRDLQRFAKSKNILSPAAVTAELMSDFAENMNCPCVAIGVWAFWIQDRDSRQWVAQLPMSRLIVECFECRATLRTYCMEFIKLVGEKAGLVGVWTYTDTCVTEPDGDWRIALHKRHVMVYNEADWKAVRQLGFLAPSA